VKISVIEACAEEDLGSIGAWYIAERARQLGHEVKTLRRPSREFDVELISVHHCDDFAKLAHMPRGAPIRIVGGHPMANNPRPVIPFADAICVGEGESWIVEALRRIERTRDVHSLADLPGTILGDSWQMGAPIPASNVERPLPENAPYLNRPGTRSAAWYVEIARGCPYKCAFCELGHSIPFRLYSVEQIKRTLDLADTKKTRKINFYAPDEASHPDYPELFVYLKEKGYAAGFSSMRIDSILRRGMPLVPVNMLIRVGVDGLCEATRQRVNKSITDDMVVKYFELLIGRGFVNFKTFFIFGYPWEKLADFEHFEHMMRRVFALPLRTNVSLRVKWTPFVPQPCTPLGREKAKYDFKMVDRINVWHALHARPHVSPGWYVENDGMLGPANHRRQCELTVGDEQILLRMPDAIPLHEMKE
jgi:radical SAM superfamily enzyme YgiQ (UPF0313 family)